MKSNIRVVSRMAFFSSVIATLLSGCSGGGGGASPAVAPASSTTSFPLQSGYKSLIANGLSKNFAVSGDCAGSGTRTISPATTAATFEGTAGFSAAGTLTMSLTNCTPASTAESYTSYYDSNYVPLGVSSVGGDYGVYLTAPAIPTSVSVGENGSIGTETYYTDSTKATVSGTVVESYVIEPDASNTAIVNLISKDYNASGTLTLTEQTRYRIAAVGTLTPISTDLQYANGSTLHIVFTYQ